MIRWRPPLAKSWSPDSFLSSRFLQPIQNFITHYHTERNHQGLANRLIRPEPGHLASAGVVYRRQRLGGKLNYHYRAA